ncbi:MAG: glycosyltransferase family 4 protein [Gemmatimonadota bacterium]|nr:glycosyltransferase family 4 protein [Gemmatimonadota bacterium]
MNILYTITRYWPAIGGAETHVRQVASVLSTRHQIDVFAHTTDQRVDPIRVSTVDTPQDHEEYYDGASRVHLPGMTTLERLQAMPAARLYHYPLTQPLGFRFYASVFGPKLSRIVREHRIDVIHNVLLGTEYLTRLSLETAQCFGLPFVITPLVHEGIWGDSHTLYGMYRRSDAVVALLDEERRLYLEHGVPEARTHVIGVSPVIAKEHDTDYFKEKHQVKGRVVLFVGRQVKSKGYREILAASSLVWEKHRDVSFAFVGPYEESEQGATHDSDPRILRLGPLSDGDKTSAMASSDVFCLPSISEIMPTAILEAWHFARPVIGGDIPTLRELTGDGECGLIVKQDPRQIADALLKLLDQPAYARQLGENGYQKLQRNYTTERVATSLEQVYDSHCGKGVARGD